MKTPAIILHIVLPLFAGAVLYLLFRPDTLLFFAWLKNIGLMPVAEKLRSSAAPLVPYLPGWALYSLPDALYTYSVTAFVMILRKGASLWIIPAAGLGVLPEVLQLSGTVPGVFDPTDLILASAACMAAILLLIKTNKYEKTIP